MGQKDITEKTLEDYEDVFADIVNGFIFHGDQRVKPADLRGGNGKFRERNSSIIQRKKGSKNEDLLYQFYEQRGRDCSQDQ